MDKKLSLAEQQELLELLEEKKRREEENTIKKYFPDEGPFRRELYHKHLKFFKAGQEFTQRAAIAANQTGKSLMVAYEVALHLTGLYPEWWEGKRFNKPIVAWGAGLKSNVRETLQEYLLGPVQNIGTGLIPKKCLTKKPNKKPGVPDVFQDIYVNHATGGVSRITFKTYDEGPEAFQGARLDLLWLDEEPPKVKIYSEAITRLVAKQGILLASFTPLFGYSDVVLSFLDDGKFPPGGTGEIKGKYVTNITWDDVPHLSEKFKEELLSSYAPHEREARSKGIPSLGAGQIYPIEEDQFLVDDFPIPKHWPRCYGFDPGANVSHTAGVWAAWDEESDVIYLYSEYYRLGGEPSVHADAVKARGQWLTGVSDYAGTRDDGRTIMNMYIEDFGLHLCPANKSVEAGLQKVWQRLSSGRLKIFKSMVNWRGEHRLYRRDEKGKVIKKSDHLMDATRYLIMTEMEISLSPLEYEDQLMEGKETKDNSTGRDPTTGY